MLIQGGSVAFNQSAMGASFPFCSGIHPCSSPLPYVLQNWCQVIHMFLYPSVASFCLIPHSLIEVFFSFGPKVTALPCFLPSLRLLLVGSLFSVSPKS